MIKNQLTGEQIPKKMLENDNFSKGLGIEILTVSPGYCELQMKVRDEMLNGFGIVHGGVIFSLADSALAFAANSLSPTAVTVESSISFFQKVESGAILRAAARMISSSASLGAYEVEIYKDSGKLAAKLKGTVYIMKKEFENR